MNIERKIITKKNLEKLVEAIQGKGRKIIAPVQKGNKVIFDEISSLAGAAQNYVQTTLSVKACVFPKYEEILRWRTEGKEIQMEKTEPAVPAVIFGLRPCDAKSFAVLKAVFSGEPPEPPDHFFQQRMENVSVVGLSCKESDESCFCASVGGGPGDTQGSDILLTETGSGTFLAEILTEKGRDLVSVEPNLFGQAGPVEKEKFLAAVNPQFEAKKLTEKLAGLFHSKIWEEQSLRCVECGACAFVCPACTCFDIQDETHGQCGSRFRCWDSCRFPLFTLHASGHNPRASAGARWRQRVMHKFSYQPQTIGLLGCVGCGRCSRACPADMNLLEHLKSL